MTLMGLTGGMPRFDPYRALADKLVLAIDWRRGDLVTVSGSPPTASQVLDVVGGRAFVQASGSQQPGYNPPGGFEFDGLDDALVFTGATGMPSGAAPWELAGIIDDYRLNNGESFAFAFGSSGGVNTSVHIGRVSPTGFRLSVGTGSSRVSIQCNVTSTAGPRVVQAWGDGTHGYIQADGGTIFSAAVAQDLSTGRARISGQSSAGSNPWSGRQFLWFGFNNMLTSDERALLADNLLYLASTIT